MRTLKPPDSQSVSQSVSPEEPHVLYFGAAAAAASVLQKWGTDNVAGKTCNVRTAWSAQNDPNQPLLSVFHPLGVYSAWNPSIVPDRSWYLVSFQPFLLSENSKNAAIIRIGPFSAISRAALY